MFLVDRQGVLGRAGQAYQHFGAEAEGPVVPATVGYRLNREVAKLRELVGDEPTHLIRVDCNTPRHRTEIRNITH
jgi:hypothetical protein